MALWSSRALDVAAIGKEICHVLTRQGRRIDTFITLNFPARGFCFPIHDRNLSLDDFSERYLAPVITSALKAPVRLRELPLEYFASRYQQDIFSFSHENVTVRILMAHERVTDQYAAYFDIEYRPPPPSLYQWLGAEAEAA